MKYFRDNWLVPACLLGLAGALLVLCAAVAPLAGPLVYAAAGCLLLAWALAVLRMRSLTRHVGRLCEVLERQEARAEQDLALAAEVHNALVPPPLEAPPFRIDVRYRPLQRIGGDLASYHVDPSAGIARVSIGDVTGHGVAAALLVNRIHHAAEDLLRQGVAPDEVLRRVNGLVWRTFGRGDMMMTFMTVLVDARAGRVTWSNAAHPPALHWRAATGAVTLLGAQTIPLGIADELPDAALDSEPVVPGDRIILHTDGLIDALDPQRRRFGMDRLIAVAGEVGGLDRPDEVAPAILRAVETFTRGRAQDDILVLTVTLDR